MADNFFDEQAEQSLIKSAIVSKYFWSWASVMIGAQKKYPDKSEGRIAYIDLFAGPGRYHDGALSTPILILQSAVDKPDFCTRLVTIFNDKDEANCRSLEECIGNIPNIKNLEYPPQVHTDEVGENIVTRFEQMRLVPTFSFIDPFGYKGLSLRLVNAVLKDWGCDCVFFFNYNRISMGISNEAVEDHMDALFGKLRADALRARLQSANASPADRETFILEELCQAIREMGREFVLPFRFRNEKGTRTTHHLVFVSKHRRGYDIMKEIMAKESSLTEQGVASFEYNRADRRQPLLFEYARPLDELEGLLLEQFAGRRMTVEQVFNEHNVGKRYIKKNYKDALMRMAAVGAVKADRPGKTIRRGSLPDDVQVAFPAK